VQSATDNDPAGDEVCAGQNAQVAVPKMSHSAIINKLWLCVLVTTIAKYRYAVVSEIANVHVFEENVAMIDPVV